MMMKKKKQKQKQKKKKKKKKKKETRIPARIPARATYTELPQLKSTQRCAMWYPRPGGRAAVGGCTIGERLTESARAAN